MRVVVDDREKERRVVRCLEGLPGIDLATRRLAVGDYLVADSVICERKSMRDLGVSIMDGRLFSQAGRLAKSEHKPICIVEGPGEGWEMKGMSREAIQGALIALTVTFGVPVLRSSGAEETARLICYVGRQVLRCAQGVYTRPGLRRASRRRRQLHVLQGLPRVGRDKAVRLLEHFGSVEAVIEADEAELCEVQGIGARTAERIRWVVREGREPCCRFEPASNNDGLASCLARSRPAAPAGRGGPRPSMKEARASSLCLEGERPREP